MATKQELQESIKKMVVVANNPKTSEAIRKTLLKSIEKAESQVKELEKAETLEKKEELTPKQEEKVEEVKEESKALVQALKSKIKTAKSSGAKTKKSTPPSSKLMQKARELARKYRTAQKGVPTGDYDIERDAGRPAMPKGKRIAKKSGKTYYENRENRIDRKQPPKNYPKLEDGGEVLMTFEEFKRKLPELHDIKWGDKGVKYIAKRNPYTDTIMYFKNGRRNSEKVSLNKAYEHYKYFVEKGQKYEDGGLMKDFNKNFTTAYILQQQLAKKEAEKSGAYTGEDNDYNYSTIYYSEKYYPSREFDGQVFASKQLHDDMRDASGSLKGSEEKDIEQSVTAYFDEDIVKKTSGKNLHQMWKDGKGVNVEKKKKGWFFKDGGYVVVNLGGDRYDGGVAYQIMKGDKIVKDGLIDGDHGVEFKGKKYDGLKSLADGIGAKLVTQKMEYGGVLLPMTGGVNADPRFDIYDTGAFMKKGGAVKRAMRFEDGGMNVGGDNEYLIMYRSDNPTYQSEDGFEGNPPDSMYADSAFDVLDYLRENMPDDVEVISIEEASDVYKKGGYMAKGGATKSMTLKQIRDKYDKNEDENYHSENVVLLAQYFGTQQELNDAKRIKSLHDAIGSLPFNLSQERNALHDKLWKKFQDAVQEKGLNAKMEYGGILQPMTGGVNADPRFDIYNTGAFMKKGGYMADGGLVKVKWSDAEYGDSARVIAENKMGLILKPYGQKFHLKFPDGTEKTYTAKELEFYKEQEYKHGGNVKEHSQNLEMLENQAKEFKHHAEELQNVLKSNPEVDAWVVAKAERATTDLSDITHYLDGLKKKMADGGSLPVGYHMMPDGTIMPDSAHMAMGGETKKYADWVDKKNELEKEISKLEKSIDADYSDREVTKLTKEKFEKLDDKKEELKRHLKSGQSMAMGGVTEHGLKEGDEIVVSSENVMVVMNQATGETAFVDIETGKREDASHLKDKLGLMKYFSRNKEKNDLFDKGGDVSLEKMYEKFREQSMAVRLKIATLIGIDTASEYLDKDLVVNPFSLIEGAVRKGFITIDEINKNVWDAAVSESNSIEDSYRDSGEGIGSSDMNAFISSMLNDAGIKVGVKDNTYQRMAKGGKVKLRISDIEQGDYVNFGEYGNYYVADTDFDELGGGSYFWVTKDKAKRNNNNASGKTMHKSDAEYIVEKYSEVEEMAKGGKVKFADKVASVKATLLKRKKVPKAVQKDYGKTFSPAEAEDSAKRIVGAKTYAERIKYLAKKNKK